MLIDTFVIIGECNETNIFWISAENYFFDGPPAYLAPGNLFMVIRKNMEDCWKLEKPLLEEKASQALSGRNIVQRL